MHFSTTAIILAITGFAAAQCPAQNILDACLGSTKPQFEACAAQDYSCMCDQITNVLTCYNNCPGDEGRSAVESQQTSWCNAAKLTSTTSTSASSMSTVYMSATASTGPMETSSSSSESDSDTGSGSSGSSQQSSSGGSEGAASGLIIPSTALLSILLGAAALI